MNPKRRQREVGRQTMQAVIGTKSQQALQLQREERKTERRQAGFCVSGMVVSMGISQEWLVLFAWKGVFSCIR